MLALEAKMIVALAFRSGPIEDLHGGKALLDLQRRQRLFPYLR
jgi:hypothetical protein